MKIWCMMSLALSLTRFVASLLTMIEINMRCRMALHSRVLVRVGSYLNQVVQQFEDIAAR